MMKKRIRRLVALGLCLMMLLFSGLMASAAIYDNEFSFKLSSHGDNQRSLTVLKDNYLSYAKFNFSTCSNQSSYPVLYRLRYGNGTEASDLKQLTGAGSRSVSYYSGCAQYGYSYYFRIQTNSSSSYGATVAGTWEP